MPQAAVPTGVPLPDAVMVTVDHDGRETSHGGTTKEDLLGSKVSKEGGADLLVSADRLQTNEEEDRVSNEEEDRVCVGSIEIGGDVEHRKKTNATQSAEHLVQRSSIRLSRLESQTESCPPIPTGRPGITRSGAKVHCGPSVGRVVRRDKLVPELSASGSGGKRNAANVKQKHLRELLEVNPERESTSVAKKKAKKV